MDKRKLKITKSGNKTTIQSKYGSSHKKVSILKNESSDFTNASNDELIKSLNQLNNSYDIDQRLNSYEEIILQWLKDQGLPTTVESLDFKGAPTTDINKAKTINSLEAILKTRHEDIKGTREAADCFFLIDSIRSYLQADNYKAACSSSLVLVSCFSKWHFALFEPTLSLGQSRQDGLLQRNNKLTDDQYEQCFMEFEKFESKDNRQGHKSRNWKKVIHFVSKEFDIKISDRTLRDKYKVWKSR